MLAGAERRARRGRRAVPQLLRRVRVRRHRAAPPTRTFDGRLDLDVGGRDVELIEVGPAHTAGDTIVHVPDAKTVYTGDILFIGGTPIVWAGPLSNWIAACDLMLGLDVDIVVPGHGPVTDKAGVAAVRDYLAYVDARGDARFDAGLDAFDAAREIGAAIGADERFGSGRVRPDRRQRRDGLPHARPDAPSPDVVEQFRRMAELEH